MTAEPPQTNPRIAADAMCGGLARWLRMFGVDVSFRPGIDDRALVEHALAEGRVVVSSDRKLFERRVFTSGRLTGLFVPVGLRRPEQIDFVVERLGIAADFPRCTCCNGRLRRVARADVADVVPARTLIWMDTFYRCRSCEHVFWKGSHWRRIDAALERIGASNSRSKS